MTALRALIVDDEHLARRGLSMRLEPLAGVEVVGECANGEEALSAIAELGPDLVFLDVQMPGLNGFDVVERIQADVLPIIIFVTAYDQFAVDAFRVNALDYLLKPLEDERLQTAVDRAIGLQEKTQPVFEKQRLIDAAAQAGQGVKPGQLAEASEQYPEKLLIKDAGEIHFVPVEQIDWIDAAGDYMCLHTVEGNHIMRTTMKQLQAQLNPAAFIRVHRSTIVNVDRVRSARPGSNGEYILSLDDAQIRVSRGYRDAIKGLIAPD